MQVSVCTRRGCEKSNGPEISLALTNTMRTQRPAYMPTRDSRTQDHWRSGCVLSTRDIHHANRNDREKKKEKKTHRHAARRCRGGGSGGGMWVYTR